MQHLFIDLVLFWSDKSPIYFDKKNLGDCHIRKKKTTEEEKKQRKKNKKRQEEPTENYTEKTS